MTPNPARSAPLVPKARRLRRSLSGAVVLAAGVVLISACSVPQVASMSKNVSTHAAAKPRTTATASPSPTASTNAAAGSAPVTAAPITVTSSAPVDRGDLKAGSLTRSLAAGDRNLVVTYWTTDNLQEVSASSPMTLQLAAHLEGGNVFDAIRVSRFHATFDDGTTTSTVSDDKGDFVLTQPFSYSTAMSLRPTVTHATLATVTVEFDLLVETQPASGQFYRQTVLDTLHIAFQAAGSTGSAS